MIDDLRPPYRIAFDNARDPYTARNALGIAATTGGPPAPVGAQYITAASDATLTAERVATNTATVTWDFATAGQAKANVVAGSFGDVFLAAANVFTNTNTFQGGGTTVQGLTGSNASQTWTNYQAAAGNPNLQIRHSRGTTLGAHAAVAVDDPLGQITFQGSDGAAFASGVIIQAFCEATPVSGHIQSNLRFSIDNGAVFNEIMRVDKTGLLFGTNFGLRGSNGTAPPAAGDVGEFLQANKTTSSGSLTAATIGTYHSISLTAGDWDVWMHSTLVCAATGTNFELELTTGASLTGSNLSYIITVLSAAGSSYSVDIQPVRFLLTSTTTINLNYRAGTTGASISNAYIAARRRR